MTETHIMSKPLLPLVLLTAGLGACSSFQERYDMARPFDERHPIEVVQDTSLIDVRTAGNRIAPGEENRVLAFLQQYRAAGEGIIAVQGPQGAAGQVADLAALAGVPRSAIAMAGGGAAAGMVRVSYVRSVAKVEPCNRNWSHNLAANLENTPYPALGCALQTNFAAQVADPRDIDGPRAMDPASAGRRDVVLDKYRKGEITAATPAEGTSGKVSGAVTGTERK
jgi:pilus assembly protein CpaD